eukprot:2118542-Rhodomonas_salina.1
MYSVRLQWVMQVHDAVFEHDCDYPFLDPTSIITPGTLTAEHINEMHATDLESGEFMEEKEDSASKETSQPGQTNTSAEGGAEKFGGFRD